MKTTKAMFNRFKKEFGRFIPILGINGYHYYFFHEQSENYAEIVIDEPGKAVTVIYGTERKHEGNSPESDARHEAIHVFLHRLTWLGDQRYIRCDELIQESERLVVVLEKIIKINKP